MAKLDIALIHAPSVYDFREKFVLYGPVSDVVPSTPIFETYPLGFITLLNYLEQKGFKVGIVNLAVKMLRNRKFNVENYLRKLKAEVYGLDLHWLVHAQGSLKITEIIKKLHPGSPVVFGGLSSTYYHLELLKKYPQVDFVLRGDTTETPFALLLERIEVGEGFEEIPNLTWRNNKEVKSNPLKFVPDNLNEYIMDYSKLYKSILRTRDLEGHLPYSDWFKHPLTAVFTLKGCPFNCVTCGGSSYSFKNFYCRKKPAFKTAEQLFKEIKIISDYTDSPIFVVGDIRLAGEERLNKFLKLIKSEKINNLLVYELFYPASEKFIKEITKASEVGIEISPESHEDKVRLSQGRNYTTKELKKCIKKALESDVKKFDIFFMAGLPQQTIDSVKETVYFIEKLIKENKEDERIHPFLAPLAPFLDPGSLAFENPQKYGYKRFCTTLEDHVEALLRPSWKYFLNYETKWMSRNEIVEATYESAYLLNEVKLKHGLITEKEAREVEDRINLSYQIIREVDNILKEGDLENQKEKLSTLYAEIKTDEVICQKDELWPDYVSTTQLKIAAAFIRKKLKEIL